MASGVASIQDELDEVANDSALDPAARVARLRSIRVELSALLGQADRYLADQELEREGSAMGRVRQFLEARSEADARGALLDGGVAPEALDAAGVLSHDELDRRLADGSIEEAIIGLPRDPALREAWSEAARVAALAARRSHAKDRFDPIGRHSVDRRIPASAVRPRTLADEEWDARMTAARAKEHQMIRSPKVAKAAAAANGEPPRVLPSLDEIEKQGLNEWPKPGPAAREVLGEAKDTQELHAAAGAASPGGGGVVYSAARKPVHDRIVGQALAGPAGELLGEDHAIVKKLAGGGTLSDEEKATLREAANAARKGGKPEALFMGGGSASGKSSALKKAPELVPHAAVHIDPDAFKEQLPEYQHMVEGHDRYAAAGVHEESADLAKRVQAETRELGLNMLVDGTGDSKAAQRDEQGNVTEPGKFAKKLIDAHEAGYHVKSMYVTVPTDEAVARSVKRAQSSGRFVPIPEVRSQHRNVSANFPEIAALPFVKEMQVFDTSGSTPKRIAHGAGGKLTIEDAAAHQAFLDKAKE